MSEEFWSSLLFVYSPLFCLLTSGFCLFLCNFFFLFWFYVSWFSSQITVMNAGRKYLKSDDLAGKVSSHFCYHLHIVMIFLIFLLFIFFQDTSLSFLTLFWTPAVAERVLWIMVCPSILPSFCLEVFMVLDH